jgi:DNA-directed RNA polymerase subunit F
MTDIVERLRSLRHIHLPQLSDEAADEIERLRQVVAQENLTNSEREAVEYFAAFHRSPREADANAAATLRALLERLGGER